MPRYFFDLHDSVEVIDDTGVELHDDGEARAHALMRASRFLGDLPDLNEKGAVIVTVRCPRDVVLLRLHLVCQVEPAPAPPGTFAPQGRLHASGG